MTAIQPENILTLAILNTIALAALLMTGWVLLGEKARPALMLGLGLAWLATLIGMIDYGMGNTGFLSWFLNPSAEKNFGAMLNSVMLVMIAFAAFCLFWQSKGSPIWQRIYWLILTILFGFLAGDEYFSWHESIVFWRGGYLILGGITGILSLVILARSDSINRKILLAFLIGLGVMGVSGVVLDSFSSQNLLDIGPIELGFLSCHNHFLGVRCTDYNFPEDMLEIFGSSLMAISLWVFLSRKKPDNSWGRYTLAAGFAWLVLIVGWLWILPTGEAFLAKDAQADYGEISLNAYSLSSETIHAGDTLDVTVYMHANQFLTKDYSLSVHLYTQLEAQSIAQDDMELGEFVYPSRGWLPFIAMRNRFHLHIPEDLATNQSYQLVLILWQGSPENVVNVVSSPLRTLDDGKILVIDGIAAPTGDTPPAADSPIYTFSTGIYLAGYELPETVQAGENTSVKFWWRSDSAQSLEMRQFLHWFNVDNPEEYLVFDQTPFAGLFPSQDWPAGFFALDSWEITLPDDAVAGTYRLQTGLFRLDNQERLSVNDAQGTAVLDNSIILGHVTVNE